MRVLVVSQYFFPENFRVNDLAAGLVERGHAVDVLTGLPNYPAGRFAPGYGFRGPWKETYKGVRVLRVPLIPRGGGGGTSLAVNYFSFALAASLLGPVRCGGGYDLILVSQFSPVTVGLPAILLKRLKRIPIIFWVLDLWPESLSATGAVTSPMAIRAVDSLVRTIYRNCDLILGASRAFTGSFLEKGVPQERIGYFPNWYEPEYDKPAEGELPPFVSLPAGFKVLFAGNVGEAQDFETILAAAERLRENPGIQWVILGEGRRKGWVEEEIRKRALEGAVHLLGRFPEGTMPAFFRAADCLLVTLRKEPIFALTVPGKVQSYLACAKPVVAALDGEGARIVEEAGAGITCGAGDAEGLAAAVLSISRLSEGERNAMGRSARRYCETNFNREKLLSALESWMAEVVARNPRKP